MNEGDLHITSKRPRILKFIRLRSADGLSVKQILIKRNVDMIEGQFGMLKISRMELHWSMMPLTSVIYLDRYRID